MNLLVTGGCGFIGSNFIDEAITRPEVNKLVNMDCLSYAGSVDNTVGFYDHSRYVFEKVDIRDAYQVARVVNEHEITHVVHFAAESHVDNSIVSPDAFIQTNIVGTFNLLQACKNVSKFVHVSTDEVYGSIYMGKFSENDPYRPNSPYSASKASSDMLVRAYYQTYGLPGIITHCSNNFGPRQHPEKLIPTVIRCCVEGKQIPVYGDGRNIRDWIFVDDHVNALWVILQLGLSGETYCIGANNEKSNLDIVEAICDQVGNRNLITFVRDRPGHDFRYAINAGKMLRQLGWKAEGCFDEDMAETVSWYVELYTSMKKA